MAVIELMRRLTSNYSASSPVRLSPVTSAAAAAAWCDVPCVTREESLARTASRIRRSHCCIVSKLKLEQNMTSALRIHLGIMLLSGIWLFLSLIMKSLPSAARTTLVSEF